VGVNRGYFRPLFFIYFIVKKITKKLDKLKFFAIITLFIVKKGAI